jgi:hypothetical protein
MFVTNDLAEFLGWVRPGDVIALDTLKAVSGLVQWADNAPVNHVGLMIDEVHFAMANEPSGDSPTPAVITTPALSEMLAPTSKTRAAQILRPHNIGDAEVERLNVQVRRFSEDAATFTALGMVALLPSTLGRSYRNFDELSQRQSQLLRLLIRAFQWAGDSALEHIPNDARTLTCSEFVYRCFTGAGIEIRILKPLGQGLPEEQPLDEGLARTERTDPPAPETVTPGDFWRSESLEPVGYFVKAPPR